MQYKILTFGVLWTHENMKENFLFSKEQEILKNALEQKERRLSK
jgi:hypothetical protein